MGKRTKVNKIEKPVVAAEKYKKDKKAVGRGTIVTIGGLSIAVIAGTYLGVNSEVIGATASILGGMGVTYYGLKTLGKGVSDLSMDKAMMEEEEKHRCK